jgi:hypothetical protein
MPNIMTNDNDDIHSLSDSIHRLFNLEISNARLLITEKCTLLISMIALYGISIIIVLCAILFLSIGLAKLLLDSLAPHLVYLIVAAFYLLLLLVLIVFRRKLIINPIARQISRILLNPPTDNIAK